MDDKSREIISKKYSALVKKYGVNSRSLHYKGSRYDKAHQRIKFQYVLSHLEKNDSLLDVGCGIGDLDEFCRLGCFSVRHS